MKLRKLILIILILALFSAGLSAKPIVAFGYMENITNSKEFGYLEFIFPNSFANSVGAVFDVQVKKPLQLEKELGEQKKSLKKTYEFFELPDLLKDIKSDIFVFGSFKPLANNNIKIKLNIFIRGENEIFTFTNIGKLETQVSRMMDRISIIIINFMSERNLYKVRTIPPGSHLSILTNLEGGEQNSLLIAFLKKGYHVTLFQNNDIHNTVDDKGIDKFRYISTAKNSYDVITDWRKSAFYYGTWTTQIQKEKIDHIKELYKRFDLNADDETDDALDRINTAFDNRIDVMLIIGFSGSRKSAWVRAIDMKEKEIIWMQSNIEAGMLSSDPITDNVNLIMNYMVTEPKNPFIKAEEPKEK